LTELRLINPTQVQILGAHERLTELQGALTYVDRGVDYQISRLKKNIWFRRRDPDGYQDHMAKLKAERKQCLLFDDGEVTWTYSGLQGLLQRRFEVQTSSDIIYPSPNPLAWHGKPRFEPYPYQVEAKEKLLQVRHGGVEICTGGGKTFIILTLVKELG